VRGTCSPQRLFTSTNRWSSLKQETTCRRKIGTTKDATRTKMEFRMLIENRPFVELKSVAE